MLFVNGRQEKEPENINENEKDEEKKNGGWERNFFRMNIHFCLSFRLVSHAKDHKRWFFMRFSESAISAPLIKEDWVRSIEFFSSFSEIFMRLSCDFLRLSCAFLRLSCDFWKLLMDFLFFLDFWDFSNFLKKFLRTSIFFKIFRIWLIFSLLS